MSDSALIFRLGTDRHVVVVFGRISAVTIDVREAGESTDAIGMSLESNQKMFTPKGMHNR